MKKGRMTSIPGLVVVCGTDSPPSSPKNSLTGGENSAGTL